MDCPLAGAIPADPGGAGEGLYAKIIDGAYGFASRCLMDLVVREASFFFRRASVKKRVPESVSSVGRARLRSRTA